jgi:DNA (cytosine-5)-methyltransferase 1
VVTDLFCVRQSGDIRLEVMWRLNTSRAEIASYVLRKLNGYGKATGLL